MRFFPLGFLFLYATQFSSYKFTTVAWQQFKKSLLNILISAQNRAWDSWQWCMWHGKPHCLRNVQKSGTESRVKCTWVHAKVLCANFHCTRFEYAKTMTNISYQWIQTQKAFQQTTHTHTLPNEWVCCARTRRIYILEPCSKSFFSIDFQHILVRFILYYIMSRLGFESCGCYGCRWGSKTKMLCHNQWLNASLSKISFLGERKKNFK